MTTGRISQHLASMLVVMGIMSIAWAGDHLPGEMEMWIWTDGEAFLVNPTDHEVRFNAYHIQSAGGFLDPDGWYSIDDRVANNDLSFTIVIGANSIGFTEANPTAYSLAELTAGERYAILQPLDWFSIGYPAPGASVDDLTFKYAHALPGGPGDVYDAVVLESAVRLVPEPASMALLAMGAMAFLRRRR